MDLNIEGLHSELRKPGRSGLRTWSVVTWPGLATAETQVAQKLTKGLTTAWLARVARTFVLGPNFT